MADEPVRARNPTPSQPTSCTGCNLYQADMLEAAGPRVTCIAFDKMLYGFCRYVKHRLELLGLRVYCFHDIHESGLELLKGKCIIVTLDCAYASRGIGPKVKLPYKMHTQRGGLKRRTYEEWWTQLCKALASMRRRGGWTEGV